MRIPAAAAGAQSAEQLTFMIGDAAVRRHVRLLQHFLIYPQHIPVKYSLDLRLGEAGLFHGIGQLWKLRGILHLQRAVHTVKIRAQADTLDATHIFDMLHMPDHAVNGAGFHGTRLYIGKEGRIVIDPHDASPL